MHESKYTPKNCIDLVTRIEADLNLMGIPQLVRIDMGGIDSGNIDQFVEKLEPYFPKQGIPAADVVIDLDGLMFVRDTNRPYAKLIELQEELFKTGHQVVLMDVSVSMYVRLELAGLADGLFKFYKSGMQEAEA